jgi:hypothetical protein
VPTLKIERGLIQQLSSQGLFEISGWLVFVFSAICYIAAGWRAGDLLGTLGGVLFLAACFLFLVPVLVARRSDVQVDES